MVLPATGYINMVDHNIANPRDQVRTAKGNE